MNKPTHVLGFAFDQSLSSVLLIRKLRPQFQYGKLNGLGGKVEPGETSAEAMAREFREECGIFSQPDDWDPFGVVVSDEARIELFTMRVDIDRAVSKTDEQVCVYRLCDLRIGDEGMMPNLPGLIALARDPMEPLVRIDYYTIAAAA